jgi:hypothetical protein
MFLDIDMRQTEANWLTGWKKLKGSCLRAARTAPYAAHNRVHFVDFAPTRIYVLGGKWDFIPLG